MLNKKQECLCGELKPVGLLFCYGTLQRAFHNNRVLGDSAFVGSAQTVDKLPMVCYGIPFLFNLPGRGKIVRGEVFNVTDAKIMANVDRLEGHPYHYYRSMIKVRLDNLSIIDTFVYFVNRDRRDESDDEADKASESRFPGRRR